MNDQIRLARDEKAHLLQYVKRLIALLGDRVTRHDIEKVYAFAKRSARGDTCQVDQYGIDPALRSLHTALLVNELIMPDRNMTIATLIYNLVCMELVSKQEVQEAFGEDVAKLVHGLLKVSQLYKKQAAVENDHFHKLLLTFAEDIRVVIMMIVDRLGLMRMVSHHADEPFVRDISQEARYLYAPLAHRLGLYTIKSELEDLSLKYLNPKVYFQIADKLNETKVERDKYVDDFIQPIRKALEESGVKFEMKGRTKSIYSIWNKMKKKGIDLNGIYDLFAIRIILDSSRESEKKECWIAYSIVTSIYTANVSRLKDWITIPKSNGYESLHITVRGPGNKWVEVQIRTKRMDEIAERGLAAHWRYKGIKSEGEVDAWMNNVREILEAGSNGQMELIRDMNMNLYEKEVFVFTPKGDLFKLPQGATILDFAFLIHSKLGSTCIGGKVDRKNQKLNYRLKSGDTVEILTASNQFPRLDWLNWVVTSKARNKIRQAINEARQKKADLAREALQRRFKNRKIDQDDATLTKLMKKLGYKSATDFFVAINDELLDLGQVVDHYVAFAAKQNETSLALHETAENFVLQNHGLDDVPDDDILVIGNHVKGINYKLSRCCNPIYGDKIVGFVASDGAIKIHRADCGNAKHLSDRYPYRMIRTRWSGKLGTQFAATVKVVGHDDIGIVANITSLINKEGDTALRNITINSHSGLFEGHLVIGVSSIATLDQLIKKIKSLKGVKGVERVQY